MVYILRAITPNVWLTLRQTYSKYGFEAPITWELLESPAFKDLEEPEQISILLKLCSGIP